ncbi:MAG: ATP-binding protein [Elusimicrobiota bacterium]
MNDPRAAGPRIGEGESLRQRLESREVELRELRLKAKQLDDRLFETRSALEAEREARQSAERELRTVSKHVVEQVEAQTALRGRELQAEAQRREAGLRERLAESAAREAELSRSTAVLEGQVRDWRRELEERVAGRQREMDAERQHVAAREALCRAKSDEIEEAYRERTLAVAAERERLLEEVGRQKAALETASAAVEAGASEMKRQLESRQGQMRQELDERMAALERAKEGFQKEALWLQQRMAQRQSDWEERLRSKTEEVRSLEQALRLSSEKLQQLKTDLADREREHAQTLSQKESELQETLLTMSQTLEKARSTPQKAAKGPSAAPVKAEEMGLRDMVGQEGRVGGITPQDLVFGIAHQIRNPLAIIKSHAEFCLGRFKLSEKEREPINAIIRSTENLGRRLDDLVDLTRPRVLHRQPCSVRQLLEQLGVLVQARCTRQGIELKHEIPETVPEANIDPEQVKEGLLHLLINAVEAMPKGGTLGLEVMVMPTNNILRIDISDTGVGIAPEHLKEIYKPFFSMKPGGVGLGLTLAAQIFGLHGGAIIADSEPGKGTVVKCYLPTSGEEG